MHLLTLWPWSLNFEPQKQYHFHKMIPYTKFEHFVIIRFWVTLWTNKQTDKQTDRQTDWLKKNPTHADRQSSDEYRSASSGCRLSDQASRLKLWVSLHLYAAIVHAHHCHLHLVLRSPTALILRASAMLKHVIGWTSVCPSVTRWYCIYVLYCVFPFLCQCVHVFLYMNLGLMHLVVSK